MERVTILGTGVMGSALTYPLTNNGCSVALFGTAYDREIIAIINPPEAAILAVGAIRRQPVVNAEGSVQIGAMMNITLSADHRAVDGALATRFVGHIKHDLENPQGLVG